ncbi:Cys-Gln thioester bond-forming surface protein, partial [Anaerotignum sp.]
MAREKQTRKMIAMALAASVATSAMPVTAFADTVDNGDGTSTTTTTTNSDGSSREVTTSVKGEGTTSAPKVTATITIDKDANGKETSRVESTTTESSNKDENGVGRSETETTTTTTTPNGNGEKVVTDVDKSWSETTTGSVTQADTPKAEQAEMESQISKFPGSTLPDSTTDATDPTGNGQNQDVNNNGEDDVDKFVSDFKEGSTASSTTTTEGSQKEHHTDISRDEDEPLEDSGNVSGSETTTNTVVKVDKDEKPVSTTEGTATLLPENQQPQDEIDGGTWSGSTSMDSEDVGNAFIPDVELDKDEITDVMEDEQDLSASINGAVAPGTTVSTTEQLYKDWKETYNAMVDKATGEVKDAAKTEAKTVKDASDNDVTMSEPTGGEAVQNIDGSTSYTYTSNGETATDTYEKKVIVTKSTDANGNVTFTTTTELIVTPKVGTQAGDPTTAPMPGKETPEYSYTFGEVVENGATEGQPVSKTEVKLPDKPEVGVSTTDDEGKTMTVTEVKEYTEVIDGVETVVGYEKVIEIKNADGEVIGTGSEVVKGEVTTTTSTKEVEKTTTIDTYTQTTTVTEKQIEKQVTTSTVTMDVDDVTRTLIVKLLSANTNYDKGHGTLENMSSIAPALGWASEGGYGGAILNADGTINKIFALNTKTEYAGNDTTADEDLWWFKQFQGNTTGNAPIIEPGGDLNEGTKSIFDDVFYKNGAGDTVYVKAENDKFLMFGQGLFSELYVGRTDPDDTKEQEKNYSVHQYILKDENGNDFYAYCVEMGQPVKWNTNYVIENLDEVDYIVGDLEDKNEDGKYDEEDGYTTEQIENAKNDAKEHIRSIVLNGFWGTASGDNSLESVKTILKNYLNKTYTGDELTRRLAAADQLSAGQAMSATQAAIWHYGNDGGQYITDLEQIIKYSARAGLAGETNDSDLSATGIINTNVSGLFQALINLPTTQIEDKESNLIDLEDITATITAKEKVADGTEDVDKDGKIDNKYNTDVSFTLAVVPGANDSLNVVVVDNNNNILARHDLNTFGNTGNNIKTTDKNGNTTYTMKNIELTEGVTINLSIDGTQHLKNGVYVYRSENFDTSRVNDPHSQTMIGIASGEREVSLDMNLTFSVEDPADATVSGSKSGHKQSRTEKTTHKENYVKTDTVVTALMEVTTTTTTTTEKEWSGEYEETWSYSGNNNNGPTDPTDPKSEASGLR